MLKMTPAVFAVGNEYQIMVPVTVPSLLWVRVGDECFFDESNGIMRSMTEIHRVSVPMEALDRAGEYTVCEKEIVDRKPYFPETKDEVRQTFSFTPVPKDKLRLYMIADAHDQTEKCVDAALAYGPIDLLVLNGDLPNHSGDPANFLTIYEICARVTGGKLPVVFARGNHDLRGYFAERFADYTPQKDGKTYYTFRLGPLWGLVLDCGEDKDDSHPEYGGTVACHVFRARQTKYIEDMITRASDEFDAPGVQYKLVIAHHPFTRRPKPPFDIEPEIYTEWSRLLRENVRPDLMLSGHRHACEVYLPASPQDTYGQPCPVVVGSDPGQKETFGHTFTGTGVTLAPEGITVEFTDHDGNLKDSFFFKK